MLNITILTSKNHPIYPFLEKWVSKKSSRYNVSLVSTLKKVKTGDILFLISFTKIVKSDVRKKFKKSLVIHASNLPKGKGWSPHIWQILEGKKKIVVTLFEAVDKVDAGDIWKKSSFKIENHELYDEINEKLFRVELELMDFALKNFTTIKPKPQKKGKFSYYKKRSPEDSEINPKRSIGSQFDLIRVSDPTRFPCFLYFRNRKYKFNIEKIKDK